MMPNAAANFMYRFLASFCNVLLAVLGIDCTTVAPRGLEAALSTSFRHACCGAAGHAFTGTLLVLSAAISLRWHGTYIELC